MKRSVYLYRHDVLTVPRLSYYCPITSMTRALSHESSNRAGDNHSRQTIFFIVNIERVGKIN